MRRQGVRACAQFGALLVTAFTAVWAAMSSRSGTAPAAPTAGAETRPSEAHLDWVVAVQRGRKLPDVKFDGVGFADVIDFIRDVSGANIVVDWRRLEQAKIDRNQPITLNLAGVKFADALTRIFDQIGDKEHKVIYAASSGTGGVIVVSTRAGLDAYASLARAAAPARPDPKVQAVLDRTLPEVKFVGVGLADVLDFMKDVTKVPIDADWKQLAAAGVDRDSPVTLRLERVTCDHALRLILWSVDSTGKDAPLLTYTVRDGRIVVLPAPSEVKQDEKAKKAGR